MSALRRSAPFDRSRPPSAQDQAEERAGSFAVGEGVSQIFGGTSQNEAVTALFERFMHQGRCTAPLAAQKVGGDP